MIESKNKNHQLPFKRENYLLFIAGIISLVLGYFFMSIGPWDSFWSMTLSPVMLLFGYVVLLPLSIMYKAKK